MKKFRKNLIGAVCAAALVCTAGGAALWTNTEKASATDAGVLVNYDFSENVDTAFAAPASTYGWITQNGKLRTDYSYSATEAKRIGYLKTPIALNESKYISFDFYAARLFDVALVETAGDFNAWSTNSIGFHTNSNNWLTLNKNIDLAAGWLADYTGVGNCLADCVHTLEIISDGAKLTFKVDGNVAFSDVAIPANEVYLVLQSTADTYIDNLYIAASAAEAQPQTGYFGFNRATEGNYFSAPVGNYGWKVSGEGFSPYLPTVEGNVVTGNKMGYLNQAIALNEAKYISLDFYAAGNTDIGLVEAANPFNGWSRTAIAVHARTEGFVNLSDYIDYGLDGSWKGDFTQLGGCVADKSHTLEIISDGANLTFKLDGETVVWNNHNENVADDIASVAIPANSVYLTVQSDNAETYIDNVYIAESAPVEETDKSFDFSGYVNEFTAQGGGAGMSAKNGKFVANNAWGAARSVETLNLTSVEKITMDFCLASSDADKQFNVGFFADFDNVSEAGTGKCISVGATLFIGSQFGRNAWIADVGANLYDDVLHTLTITFADGNMSVMVDNIAYETLTTAIPAEEAYMLMQLTSTASYVDNLTIKYKEIAAPTYDLTIKDLAGETVTTIENVSGEFTIPEYPTAQGKVFLGYLVGNQLFQAGDTVVINQDFTITAIEATFAMVDGASIRIDAPTGMRFTTTLTWDAYDAISSFASFGTLIAKAEDVAADYTDLTTAFDGTYLNIEQTKYQEKNGNFQFNGVLVNIKDNHHNWNFASRAYMTVTYTDGDEVTFYTNGETRSVNYIAKEAFLDREDTQQGDYIHYIEEEKNYSKYTDDQLDTLYKFCKDVLESNPAEAYVSTQGNDTNIGYSTRSAVATIARALEIVEGQENATVYLLDGEYEISETVEIPSNVTVESLSGNAMLSGASKVSATEIVEKTDAKLGRVWEIPCKKKPINCM